MSIRKTKNNEDMPDFDEMMSEVNEDIQEKDAEQDIISRVPELRKLRANIDQATANWASATCELEMAIEQYDRAERKLDSTVTDIRGKVDNINTHIDDVMKDAPDKLKVSVNLADADWQKMQDLFDLEHKWMARCRRISVRSMPCLSRNAGSVQKRYKEYDGCYLGHYAQWFFFVLGFFIFTAAIVMMVGKWCNRF